MNYSEWSATKNMLVGGIFKWLMTASKSVMRRYSAQYRTYHYIDMNAADGSGSPSIFLDTANKIDIYYQALFIERSRKEYLSLAAKYDHSPLIQLCCGDHNEILLPHCQSIKGKPYGLIYNDPCGIPSFSTLAIISQLPQIEHIDMLINCPATAIKRRNGVFGGQCLVDGLDEIKKKHWLVRAPYGRWQWTILVGTNWTDMKSWRAQQLYPINSSEGQAVLDRMNRTRSEREGDNGQLTIPNL